ncbi:MAG: hypothetical protein V1798_08450 [Pseudomonadota bacterium]
MNPAHRAFPFTLISLLTFLASPAWSVSDPENVPGVTFPVEIQDLWSPDRVKANVSGSLEIRNGKDGRTYPVRIDWDRIPVAPADKIETAVQNGLVAFALQRQLAVLNNLLEMFYAVSGIYNDARLSVPFDSIRITADKGIGPQAWIESVGPNRELVVQLRIDPTSRLMVMAPPFGPAKVRVFRSDGLYGLDVRDFLKYEPEAFFVLRPMTSADLANTLIPRDLARHTQNKPINGLLEESAATEDELRARLGAEVYRARSGSEGIHFCSRQGRDITFQPIVYSRGEEDRVATMQKIILQKALSRLSPEEQLIVRILVQDNIDVRTAVDGPRLRNMPLLQCRGDSLTGKLVLLATVPTQERRSPTNLREDLWAKHIERKNRRVDPDGFVARFISEETLASFFRDFARGAKQYVALHDWTNRTGTFWTSYMSARDSSGTAE